MYKKMGFCAVFSCRLFTFAPVKQHLFQLLLTLLLLAFSSQQEVLALDRDSATVPETDRIYDNSSKHVPFGEALLTDSHDGGRIIAPRVQRLLPTGHGRSVGHRFVFVSQKVTTALTCSRSDGHCRWEVTPHQDAPACQYYVIALRRILR